MSRTLILLAIAAYCSVWLVTDHFLPWVSWHSEAMVFLSVALVSWRELVQVGLGRRDPGLKIPGITLPFFIVGLVGTLQALTGMLSFWGDVWINWFYIGLCAICISIGFETGLRSSDQSVAPSYTGSLVILSYVLIGGAILSTGIALIQTFDVWEMGRWITGSGALRRPGANLSQPNHLATFLMMGLVSSVYLHQLKLLSPGTALLLVAYLLFGLSVSESRTGVLSLILMVLWFISKRNYLPIKISLQFLIGLCAAFAALFYAWPGFWRRVHFFDGAIEANFTSSGRLDIWTQIADAVAQRPLLGWGIRQVPEAHNSVVHQYASVLSITYSHNLLLDLAIWLGVPLALLLVWWVGHWLYARIADTRHILPWYCLGLALPLAVHSMLEFPFAYAYFLAPVLFALGVLEGWFKAKPILHLSKTIAIGLLTLASVTLAWSAVEYFQIEEEFRIARFESLRIGQVPPNHIQQQPVLLTQLGGLVGLIRVVPKPAMSEEQIEFVKRVALHYPWSATLSRYAQVLALNGKTEEAEHQFQVIRLMFGEGAALRARARLKELQEKGLLVPLGPKQS
jgi:O-antigen ligase